MNHSPGWNPDNLNTRILQLWNAGLDTFAIGKKVGRPEFEVYNRLWHLRNGKMKIARLRLRVIDKATRRTGIAFYPWDDGIALSFYTGEKRLITDKAGYSEYNDRGQPVLDSWMEPTFYFNIFGPGKLGAGLDNH